MKNLQYGNKLSEQEVIEKCNVYDLNNLLIKDLSAGYFQFSKSGGINLSTGQRQKVHYLRGIIRETDILLIDDCLQGVNSADKIFMELKTLETNKNILFYVTNNPSLPSKFDKILFFTHSDIKFGTYEELENHVCDLNDC